MPAERSPILVGYDASPDAELALTWAARTAESRRQAVRVVCVANDLDPMAGHFADRRAQEWSLAAKERLARLGVTYVDVLVEHGPTVPVLLAQAASAELLVVGSRGHGLLLGSLTGSVSQHLAYQAPCPVVVVRPAAFPVSRHVVVGVDGSGGSAAALRFACERAETTGERVVAVHGYHGAAVAAGGLAWPPTAATLGPAEEAERLLAEAVAGLRADHPDVELVAEAVPVHPQRLLVDYSSTASLVVVGSRGRDLLSDLLLGSVSQHVLHHAECPVAVVR